MRTPQASAGVPSSLSQTIWPHRAPGASAHSLNSMMAPWSALSQVPWASCAVAACAGRATLARQAARV